MTATAPSVRFEADDGFLSDVRARVARHFAEKGVAPSGGPAMVVKTAVIAAWLVGSHGLLLAFGAASPLLAAALTISVALATAAVGFAVMHDANHGAYAASARVNRAMSFSLDLVGASSWVWRSKHNVAHHTWANVEGLDADVDAEPFLRLAPGQARRGAHRWQHLYAWPLYGVLALKWWLWDDARDLVLARLGRHRYPRPSGRALVTALAGKGLFLGWALALPLALHRSPWVLAWFLLGATTLGVVLATVFQLAHAVPGARFHVATDGGRLPTGWAEHQVRATADFAPSNRLLGWYVGGLNFQVEHHLFPTISHVHYRALAPIVAEACRAHGIPHVVQPTLRAAIAAHYRHLRALGRLEPAAAG